jgi:hypothetical protein
VVLSGNGLRCVVKHRSFTIVAVYAELWSFILCQDLPAEPVLLSDCLDEIPLVSHPYEMLEACQRVAIVQRLRCAAAALCNASSVTAAWM